MSSKITFNSLPSELVAKIGDFLNLGDASRAQAVSKICHESLNKGGWGTITHSCDGGWAFFVAIDEGLEGVVDPSDTNEAYPNGIEKPRVGDKIRVRVIHADMASRRVKLAIAPLIDSKNSKSVATLP